MALTLSVDSIAATLDPGADRKEGGAGSSRDAFGPPSKTPVSMQGLFPGLAMEQELAHLLRLIPEVAGRALGAERAYLFLVDHPRAELTCFAPDGAEGLGESLPLSGCIAGSAVVTGNIVKVAHASNCPWFNPLVDADQVLCIPLRGLYDAVVGVIEVTNQGELSFSLEDEARLAEVCSQASRLLTVHLLLGTELP